MTHACMSHLEKSFWSSDNITMKADLHFIRGHLRSNEVKFIKIRIFGIYFSKNRILIKLTLHEAENFQWDLTIISSEKITFGSNYKFLVILGRILNFMQTSQVIYKNDAVDVSFLLNEASRSTEVTRGQKSRKRSVCRKICLDISRGRPRSKIEKKINWSEVFKKVSLEVKWSKWVKFWFLSIIYIKVKFLKVKLPARAKREVKEVFVNLPYQAKREATETCLTYSSSEVSEKILVTSYPSN